MKRELVVGIITALCMFTPAVSLAVGLTSIVPSTCNGQGGCQSICDLATLAQNVLNDGIFIAVFLSAILFAWAGWKMVVGSSSGNMPEIAAAKKIFWNVSIGLIVIVSAWMIVSVIMSSLSSNPKWNILCSQPPVGAAATGVGAQPY